MRIIDFHTHLDERWFDRPLMDIGTFIDGLDRCGVERACIFTMMGLYEDCRRNNDLLAARTADVKYLVDTVGADRVVFGSDFGLSDWMIIDDRLDSIRLAGLSESDVEKILYSNAAKLLHLQPD